MTANHCELTCYTTNVKIDATYTIPTGACCTGICTCNVTTQAACSGTWYQGQSCPGSCPACPPTGACCNGTNCTITYEVNCNGTWKGAGTNCTGNPCDGACCDGVGGCRLTDEAGCSGPGEVYRGDGTECTTQGICDPSGACCAADFGGCSLQTEANCNAQSGTYQGDDTTCTPSPCPFGHGGPIFVG